MRYRILWVGAMHIEKLSNTAIEMIDVTANALRLLNIADSEDLAGEVIVDLCAHFGAAPCYLGSVSDSAQLKQDALFVESLPPTAQQMIRQLSEFLTGKFHPKTAQTLAIHVIAALALLFGGRPVYIPRNDAMKRARRNAQIWAEQGKLNVRELAAKHGLCVQEIYKIIAARRAEMKKKRAAESAPSIRFE